MSSSSEAIGRQTRPMKPGWYLEKRRIMAAYSLASLARDLMIITDFGGQPRLDDFQRLKLRLVSAEQGSRHLSRERIELIRNFVPLDADIYFRLIALDRRGTTGPVADLCRVCGCSFFDPCIRPPRGKHETAAQLGRATCNMIEPDLCSSCQRVEARVSVPPPSSSMPEEAAIRLVPNEGGR